jgi:hypothetical protein
MGMDQIENTVSLLLFNYCLAYRAENTTPLLLFAGRCLATAAVQSPISRSPSNNWSTCHNIIMRGELYSSWPYLFSRPRAATSNDTVSGSHHVALHDWMAMNIELQIMWKGVAVT